MQKRIVSIDILKGGPKRKRPSKFPTKVKAKSLGIWLCQRGGEGSVSRIAQIKYYSTCRRVWRTKKHIHFPNTPIHPLIIRQDFQTLLLFFVQIPSNLIFRVQTSTTWTTPLNFKPPNFNWSSIKPLPPSPKFIYIYIYTHSSPRSLINCSSNNQQLENPKETTYYLREQTTRK